MWMKKRFLSIFLLLAMSIAFCISQNVSAAKRQDITPQFCRQKMDAFYSTVPSYSSEKSRREKKSLKKQILTPLQGLLTAVVEHCGRPLVDRELSLLKALQVEIKAAGDSELSYEMLVALVGKVGSFVADVMPLEDDVDLILDSSVNQDASERLTQARVALSREFICLQDNFAVAQKAEVLALAKSVQFWQLSESVAQNLLVVADLDDTIGVEDQATLRLIAQRINDRVLAKSKTRYGIAGVSGAIVFDVMGQLVTAATILSISLPSHNVSEAQSKVLRRWRCCLITTVLALGATVAAACASGMIDASWINAVTNIAGGFVAGYAV